MAERFRLQIAQTGREESADILRRSLPEIRSVVNHLDLTISRFKEQSQTVDQSIEIHSRKLGQSSATLRDTQQQLDRIEQAAKAPAAVSPHAAPKRGKKN